MNPEDKFKALKAKKPEQTISAPPAKKAVSASDRAAGEISSQFTETVQVDIRSRKEQFFKGEAKTVSSINDTGEFDVLPRHANFVTLIRGYVVVDKGLKSEKRFEIDNGVLASKTGAVDVYLDF